MPLRNSPDGPFRPKPADRMLMTSLLSGAATDAGGTKIVTHKGSTLVVDATIPLGDNTTKYHTEKKRGAQTPGVISFSEEKDIPGLWVEHSGGYVYARYARRSGQPSDKPIYEVGYNENAANLKNGVQVYKGDVFDRQTAWNKTMEHLGKIAKSAATKRQEREASYEVEESQEASKKRR